MTLSRIRDTPTHILDNADDEHKYDDDLAAGGVVEEVEMQEKFILWTSLCIEFGQNTLMLRSFLNLGIEQRRMMNFNSISNNNLLFGKLIKNKHFSKINIQIEIFVEDL